MSTKITKSVTAVHVEKQSGSDAKATVNKDGKQNSANGKTVDEALSKVSRKVEGIEIEGVIQSAAVGTVPIRTT